MAREKQAKRINRLVACAVVLAETLAEFLEVSGIDVPVIKERLATLQELAYGAITADEMEDFGRCYLAIKGQPLPEPQESVPA